MKFLCKGVQKLQPEQIDLETDIQIDRHAYRQTQLKTLPTRILGWYL